VQLVGEAYQERVVSRPGGIVPVCYRLTGEGHELLEALAPIDAWAKRWAKHVRR
jgi:DNA-binding HxlR family transcriptional regulator